VCLNPYLNPACLWRFAGGSRYPFESMAVSTWVLLPMAVDVGNPPAPMSAV
jgi:hypothetical protein